MSDWGKNKILQKLNSALEIFTRFDFCQEIELYVIYSRFIHGVDLSVVPLNSPSQTEQ